MPIKDDYFEESQCLAIHSNPIMSGVAKVLHREWRELYRTKGQKPKGDFNFLYFYLSVTKLIALHLDDQELLQVVGSIDCPSIQIGLNEDVSKMVQQNNCFLAESGLLERYFFLVQNESVQDGGGFDLAFAVSVISSAFDEKTFGLILSGVVNIEPEINPPFDEEVWLSGFFAPENN